MSRLPVIRRVDRIESELAVVRAENRLLAEAFRRLIGEPVPTQRRPSLRLVRGSESQPAR
jgi:anti-sigma factor RsiW